MTYNSMINKVQIAVEINLFGYSIQKLNTRQKL